MSSSCQQITVGGQSAWALLDLYSCSLYMASCSRISHFSALSFVAVQYAFQLDLGRK